MIGPTPFASPSGSAADGWLRGAIRPVPDRARVTRAADHAVTDHAAPATARPRRLVIKVGGSILSRPGWPSLLATLVRRFDRLPCRIVVGGGAVVEGLRSIDRAGPQPAALVHAVAIDAMRLTARLVSSAVGLPLAADMDEPGGPAVLDVPAWLGSSPAAARLPAGWRVTSDSIAACVATEHGHGLLLVKSVPPPPCPGGTDPVAALAAAGWVDEHFPVAAAGLVEIGWAAPVAG